MHSHENDLSINRSPPDLDQSSFTAYKSLLIARDSFAPRTKVQHGVYNGLQFSYYLTYSDTSINRGEQFFPSKPSQKILNYNLIFINYLLISK